VDEVVFEWDDDNTDHIARHDFVPDEVEEVFASEYQLYRTRGGRYLAWGQTLDGRMTLVVFERPERRRIRVITAREMTKRERRRFRRKK
jgi:uncharacterized DUF497 family protein